MLLTAGSNQRLKAWSTSACPSSADNLGIVVIGLERSDGSVVKRGHCVAPLRGHTGLVSRVGLSLEAARRELAGLELDGHRTVAIDAWNSRDFDCFADVIGDNAVLHIAGGVVPCDRRRPGERSVLCCDEIVIFRIARGKIVEAVTWRQLGAAATARSRSAALAATTGAGPRDLPRSRRGNPLGCRQRDRGGLTCLCGRRRDVLIDAEQVLRVVARFHGREPRVVLAAGGLDPALGLVVEHEVDVPAFQVERVSRVPAARPHALSRRECPAQALVAREVDRADHVRDDDAACDQPRMIP